MTGEKFLRGFITPIDPKNIFFMLQSGYPADFILGLSVESLNGLRNRAAAGDSVREADPGFVRVLQLLRLSEDQQKFVLLYSPMRGVDNEFAVNSRSLLQILQAFASYVAVQYRGHWFWVDDNDWRTKRALTAVMFFFTLADTGAPEALPLVTIPAQ
jgi:hypothetical protein